MRPLSLGCVVWNAEERGRGEHELDAPCTIILYILVLAPGGAAPRGVADAERSENEWGGDPLPHGKYLT